MKRQIKCLREKEEVEKQGELGAGVGGCATMRWPPGINADILCGCEHLIGGRVFKAVGFSYQFLLCSESEGKSPIYKLFLLVYGFAIKLFEYLICSCC